MNAFCEHTDFRPVLAAISRYSSRKSALDISSPSLPIRSGGRTGLSSKENHISQYVSGKQCKAEILRFLAGEAHVGEDWLVGKNPRRNQKVSRMLLCQGGKEMREFKNRQNWNMSYMMSRGTGYGRSCQDGGRENTDSETQYWQSAPFSFRTPDEVIYDMRLD